MKNERPTSRRRWIADLLRGGLLAGFGAAACHLLRRDRAQQFDCRDPKGRIGCRACSGLDECSLPRALSFKQFLKNNRNHENTAS